MTTKEILNQSIVFIGPIGVGKTLLSSELAKATGMDIVHLDELEEFVYYYSHGRKLYFDPLRKFLQTRKITKDANAETEIGSLTKTQKRLQKALIQEKFASYKKYNSMVGGFSSLLPIIEEIENRDNKVHIDYNRPTLIALLSDNVRHVELLLPVLQRLKKPIILDAGGPCFMDLSKYKNELVSACNDNGNKEEVSAELNAIKKFVSLFGTRVYLRPSDYYKGTKPPIIDFPLNRKILELDAYAPLANVTITPTDLFFDHKNSAFVNRENISDIANYETRQKLKNSDRIRELINIIILSRDNILSQQK